MDGQRVLGVETPDEQPVIAQVFGAAVEDQPGHANARLIAAAPELLQACIDARNAYQQMFDVMPMAWQTFDHILAQAITKATQ
jgi:hypothetical protein